MHVTKAIRQLAWESAFYGLSGALGNLISFFLIPVYTRVFTPADLGTASLIDATVTLLTLLSVLGLDNAMARWFYDSAEADERRRVVSSAFWCQFAVAMFIAALVGAFARPIAQVVCGDGDRANLVILAACTLPLTTAIRVFGGWLRYQRKAAAAAAFITFRSLSNVGLIVLFVVVYCGGLEGLYAARLLAVGIAAVISVMLLRSWINPRKFSKRQLKAMLVFGLPMAPAAIGSWIMLSADRFVLRIFWPQDVVGLYDLAAKVSAGVALAIMAFEQAWGPFAYSIMDREEEARLVYARVWDVYAFFGCWLTAAVGLFAPLLLQVMATEEFYPAASCVAILAFVHLLGGARYIAGLGSGIAKRSAPMAAAIGIGAVANLILNFLLVPFWGREGAALSTVAASLVSLVYLFIVSQAGHRIEYRWGISIISAAASAGLVTAAWCFVPETTPGGLAVRLLLALLFAPLGAALGIIRRQRFREFFTR